MREIRLATQASALSPLYSSSSTHLPAGTRSQRAQLLAGTGDPRRPCTALANLLQRVLGALQGRRPSTPADGYLVGATWCILAHGSRGLWADRRCRIRPSRFFRGCPVGIPPEGALASHKVVWTCSGTRLGVPRSARRAQTHTRTVSDPWACALIPMRTRGSLNFRPRQPHPQLRRPRRPPGLTGPPPPLVVWANTTSFLCIVDPTCHAPVYTVIKCTGRTRRPRTQSKP